jgi:hypothetical protein
VIVTAAGAGAWCGEHSGAASRSSVLAANMRTRMCYLSTRCNLFLLLLSC